MFLELGGVFDFRFSFFFLLNCYFKEFLDGDVDFVREVVLKIISIRERYYFFCFC